MIMTMIIDLYADVMTLLVMAEHYRHGNNDDYNDVVQFPVESRSRVLAARESHCMWSLHLHVMVVTMMNMYDDNEDDESLKARRGIREVPRE